MLSNSHFPYQKMLVRLLDMYGEEHRHYHNWGHVSLMLMSHSKCAADAEYVLSPQLQSVLVDAILWHDCVYEVGAPRGQNEYASAVQYRMFMQDHITHEELSWATVEHIDMVCKAIESTGTHFLPRGRISRVQEILLDLDLLAFASNFHQFTEAQEDLIAESATVMDASGAREKHFQFLESVQAKLPEMLPFTSFNATHRADLQARAESNIRNYLRQTE